MRSPKVLFLTGLGAGLSPVAPGTAGSVVGLLLYLLFLSKMPCIIALFVILFVMGLSIHFCEESVALFGEEDSPKIVIDEIVGMWVSLFCVKLSFYSVVDAFLIFRFFDIYKPYPVRFMDRLGGGAGIVMDDVMAGILTNIILRIIF
ncbi:MAG: phosphatidylglycerophosphatase A [Deferribacteres bacterium]|nr:phosphatidylglycerophosphatase A [Deferribacteres bacterium]